MTRDKLYIEHILECIRRIDSYSVAGREVFVTQTLVQDAVLRNLQILAESAGRISAETQALAPEIPWQQVRGFRNFVVHEYLGVDLDFVWEIIRDDCLRCGDRRRRCLSC